MKCSIYRLISKFYGNTTQRLCKMTENMQARCVQNTKYGLCAVLPFDSDKSFTLLILVYSRFLEVTI